MDVKVFPDAAAAARGAAVLVAEEARNAVRARGSFVFAVSGGSTPWIMLRELSEQDVPWRQVHIVQVDERVAARGSDERNLTHLQQSLLEYVPLPAWQLHAMPVEADELDVAAKKYARTLKHLGGDPPVLDLAHLGLGADGHTASLVPGDAALNVTNSDVAITGLYQGRQRMTLTYPVLNRARRVLWLVTGDSKAGMLRRLRDGDRSIPAGCIESARATILADQAAAKELGA